MKRWILWAVLAALIATSCGSSNRAQTAVAETGNSSDQASEESANEGSADTTAPPVTSAPTSTTTVPPTTTTVESTTTVAPIVRQQQGVMRDLLTAEDVEGSNVEIIATEDDLEVLVSSVGLAPGHPVTAWLVFFNDVDECSQVVGGGCEPLTLHILDMPEFGNIGYLGGALVDDAGSLTITAKVSTGMIPSAWWDTEFVTPLPAVYHIVLMDHGPPIEGLVDEMLATHRAGCTDESIAAWLPPAAFEDGTPGPNTCVEVQGTRFEP